MFSRLALGAVIFASCLSQAQTPIHRRPLDSGVFDSWKSIRQVVVSNDGNWIMYAATPQEGDNVVEVKALKTGKSYSFERGTDAKFTRDSHFVVATIAPKFLEVKKAKKDKAKPEDMPKNGLLILNLDTGNQTTFDRVTSYTLPEEDNGWFVYRPEPPKVEAPKADAKKDGSTTREVKSGPNEPAKKPTKKPEDKPGSRLVLRCLATAKEEKIEDVVNWAFPKDGSVLAYSLSTKDGSGDGVVWYDFLNGKRMTAVTAMGRYPKLALQNSGKLLAFVTDKDDYAAKQPSPSLHLFDPKSGLCLLVAKEGSAGIPKGWRIADDSLAFSDKGRRLLFNTRPKPEGDKKDDGSAEDKVSVDVWSWTDPEMMPQQLLQAEKERNRTYGAIYDIDRKNVVQLATPSMPDVTIGERGDAEVALGSSLLPYRQLVSWDTEYRDYYLVDPTTGRPQRIISKAQNSYSLSPGCKYVWGYDETRKHYVTVDTKSLAVTAIGADMPYPVYDEQNDVPADPAPYGWAGWTRSDERFLVYDDFDIWSVDPTGHGQSECLTGHTGRQRSTVFRYVKTDPEEDVVPESPLLLRSFDVETKASGFSRVEHGKSTPEVLIMADKSFMFVGKAKHANVVAFTREDFSEERDLWVSDDQFKDTRKVSDVNPQAKDFYWGSPELVHWASTDGIPLKGILIKPDDFDYGKKYPMIVYFYERSSDNLHSHFAPAPSPSTINPSVFASNGYLVFVPDVVYKVGYPGESAMSCVVPGILNLLQRGYVDPKRIGVEGHSWGGYQIAYMVTQTRLFACAEAGAPVGDMVSAYGGIRWGAGISREFQYEKSQSRLGGTLWEKPLRFLENSPLFFADKITTPLLMMANDKDGAVPWYQGIELFSAMRRLQKPCWLVVYNGEDHNLVERKNRKDWSVRLQQFFDHYLKDAPMPVWMARGVPATEKGRTLGEELVGK